MTVVSLRRRQQQQQEVLQLPPVVASLLLLLGRVLPAVTHQQQRQQLLHPLMHLLRQVIGMLAATRQDHQQGLDLVWLAMDPDMRVSSQLPMLVTVPPPLVLLVVVGQGLLCIFPGAWQYWVQCLLLLVGRPAQRAMGSFSCRRLSCDELQAE